MINNQHKTLLILFVFGLFWWLISSTGAMSNNPALPGYPFCEPSNGFAYEVTDGDIVRHEALMQFLAERVSHHAPVGEIVTAAGLFFLETPYIAGTLDKSDDEALVINFRGMDCVTFVESALGAAVAYRAQQTAFDAFATMLKCIRYRDGHIDGYPSRLHYFTDWLQDNAGKGILEIVSNELGHEPMDEIVNFMSSHAHLYKQLNDPAVLQQTREAEKNLSLLRFNYIPKTEIELHEGQIEEGDILAFVTSIAGLDVSHTGIAVFVDGRLHLMHASTRTQRVELTEVPLHTYIEHNQRVTGILVARVL